MQKGALRPAIGVRAPGWVAWLLAATAALAVFGPGQALGVWLLLGAILLIVLNPMVLVSAYAAVIASNAADVATTYHGMPPLGGLAVPFLAVLLLARAALTGEAPRGIAPVTAMVAAYFGLRALSLPAEGDLAPTSTALIDLGKNLLIVVVFAGYLTSMGRVRAVTAAAAAAIAAVATLSVFQYATGTFHAGYGGFAVAALRQIAVGEADSWRLTGPVWDANFFGQFLVVGLPLVAVFAGIGRTAPIRLAALAGTVAVLAATVLTFSRGALFAVLLVVLVAVLLRGGGRILAGFGGLCLAGVAAAPMLMPQSYLDRLSLVAEAARAVAGGGQWIADPALQERLSVIAAALRMAALHPLLGIGIGQFPQQYPDYAVRFGLDPGAPAAAHSLYLETLAEGGVLGLLALLALAGAILVLGNRARRRLAAEGAGTDAALVLALQLSAVGFLATSIFLHGAYQRLFWLDAALLLSVWSSAQARPSRLSSSSAERRPPMFADRLFLRQVLLLMWRRRLLLFIFALCGLAAGWIDLQRAPRAYAAEETLLYRFGRDYFPVTPGEARRNWGENVSVSLDNALFTEMQLLQAHRLFEAAADRIWPPDSRQMDATGQIPTTQQLADRLARHFRVVRVQGAAMVRVTAWDALPEVADKAVQAQVTAYLAERQRLFDSRAQAFYEARIAADLSRLAELTRQRDALNAAKPEGVAAMTARQVALQPVEAALSEVRSDLALLAQERAAASLSNAYRREVAPVVEVVDHRPAAGNPIGLSDTMRLAAATVAATLLGMLVVFIAALLASLRIVPVPPAVERGMTGGRGQTLRIISYRTGGSR
ncbi:MAG: O-antigen ligase family protein [Paracoccaceae bacterium]|nr:O-antigen ligase family protein [Paracoccaceae bacterium]